MCVFCVLEVGRLFVGMTQTHLSPNTFKAAKRSNAKTLKVAYKVSRVKTSQSHKQPSSALCIAKPHFRHLLNKRSTAQVVGL